MMTSKLLLRFSLSSTAMPGLVMSFVARAALLLTVLATPCEAFEHPEFIHRWQLDPDLKVSWVKDPDRRYKPVDLNGLNSSSKKRTVEQARYIVRFAANIRYAGEHTVVLDTVLKRLAKKENSRQVRLALLSAAIAVSDGERADEIWGMANDDLAAQSIVERALIRWENPVAIEIWRSRLGDPAAAPALLIRSLGGMEVLGESSDLPALANIIESRAVPQTVRLAACRAYGAIADSGAEGLAQQVLQESSGLATLMCAYLLRNHTSNECSQIIKPIAEGRDFASAALAIPTLARSNAVYFDRNAQGWIKHVDSSIRLAAIEALRQSKSDESINTLAIGLEDTVYEVRAAALEALAFRSKVAASRETIDTIVDHYLATGTHRSMEQIIQLVVHLHDHERCARLIELLSHPRAEVYNAAAWALEQLVTKSDISFLVAILEHVSAATDAHFGGTEMTVPESVKLAFLFEILGKHQVKKADAMLQKYIPKYIAPTVARAAAIWALGRIWEDQANAQVTQKLSGRLNDYSPANPEDQEVKYVCAIAMAMIAHPSTFADIESYHDRPPAPVGVARGWALKELNSKSNN